MHYRRGRVYRLPLHSIVARSWAANCTPHLMGVVIYFCEPQETYFLLPLHYPTSLCRPSSLALIRRYLFCVSAYGIHSFVPLRVPPCCSLPRGPLQEPVAHSVIATAEHLASGKVSPRPFQLKPEQTQHSAEASDSIVPPGQLRACLLDSIRLVHRSATRLSNQRARRRLASPWASPRWPGPRAPASRS